MISSIYLVNWLITNKKNTNTHTHTHTHTHTQNKNGHLQFKKFFSPLSF